MYTVMAIFHLLFHSFADSPSLWGPQGWVIIWESLKTRRIDSRIIRLYKGLN